MPPADAYSGAELRIRDKAVQEKHDKELGAQEAKYQRLRHAYDQLSNDYFTSVKRGDSIAVCLGFRSFPELQAYVDVADEQIPYKHLSERVDELRAELEKERRESEAMKDVLVKVHEERDFLLAQLAERKGKASESNAQALAKELVELQARLDIIQERANRANAEFKGRYARWRAFKEFMETEEQEYKRKAQRLRSEEKTRQRDSYYSKRRQKFQELGLDSDDLESEGANNETPNKAWHSTIPLSCSRTVVEAPLSGSEIGVKPSSIRVPLGLVTNNNRDNSPIPSPAPKPSMVTIDLSETQTGSSGRSFHTHPTSVSADMAEVANGPSVSQKRPPAPYPTLPAPYPTLPARRHFLQIGDSDGEKQKQQLHHNVFSASSARHVCLENDNADLERPDKIRRLSSPVRTPLAKIPTSVVRSPMNDTRSTNGRENRQGPASTPVHTDASKQRTDYSVYKGRGRYGKTPAENDTINSSYAIDPARNGGVHFQYEEVVRGREDRTRLEGVDCECCREYYTAIGPLPARLQPPLWRSPPNSPQRKPCRYTHPESGPRRNDATDGVAIAAHKQAISRHRHNWAQGSTPPSFWDISFPTTQEAENINARAEEIHQQKRRRVQEEAENGGRYYKR